MVDVSDGKCSPFLRRAFVPLSLRAILCASRSRPSVLPISRSITCVAGILDPSRLPTRWRRASLHSEGNDLPIVLASKGESFGFETDGIGWIHGQETSWNTPLLPASRTSKRRHSRTKARVLERERGPLRGWRIPKRVQKHLKLRNADRRGPEREERTTWWLVWRRTSLVPEASIHRPESCYCCLAVKTKEERVHGRSVGLWDAWGNQGRGKLAAWNSTTS